MTEKKTDKEIFNDAKKPERAFDNLSACSLSILIKQEISKNPSKWKNFINCENHIRKEMGDEDFYQFKIELDKWLDASLEPWIDNKINKNIKKPKLAKQYLFYLLQQIFINNITEN